MALLRDQNPAAHAKMLDLMRGDVNDPVLRELSSEISNILRGDAAGLQHIITTDEVIAYQGIKSTNAVHTPQGQDKGTATADGSILYHTYSLINHSCYSNTRSDIQSDGGGFAMKVYAQRPIAAGEEVMVATIPLWTCHVMLPIRGSRFRNSIEFIFVQGTELGIDIFRLRKPPVSGVTVHLFCHHFLGFLF